MKNDKVIMIVFIVITILFGVFMFQDRRTDNQKYMQEQLIQIRENK